MHTFLGVKKLTILVQNTPWANLLDPPRKGTGTCRKHTHGLFVNKCSKVRFYPFHRGSHLFLDFIVALASTITITITRCTRPLLPCPCLLPFLSTFITVYFVLHWQ